jgi:hypothetical protein
MGETAKPVTPHALEIEIGDAPERWAALGFAPRDGVCEVGGVRLLLAGGEPGIHRIGFDRLAAEHPDGLPFLSGGEAATGDPPQPNGAVAVDHVVTLTDDLERTCDALVEAGLHLARLDPPYAFLPARTLLVEVVERGAAPTLWGLVVSVADLDAAAALLGDRLGTPGDAVQPGRRIATVRRDAGLSVALALMSPRAQP